MCLFYYCLSTLLKYSPIEGMNTFISSTPRAVSCAWEIIIC